MQLWDKVQDTIQHINRQIGNTDIVGTESHLDETWNWFRRTSFWEGKTLILSEAPFMDHQGPYSACGEQALLVRKNMLSFMDVDTIRMKDISSRSPRPRLDMGTALLPNIAFSLATWPSQKTKSPRALEIVSSEADTRQNPRSYVSVSTLVRTDSRAGVTRHCVHLSSSQRVSCSRISPSRNTNARS